MSSARDRGKAQGALNLSTKINHPCLNITHRHLFKWPRKEQTSMQNKQLSITLNYPFDTDLERL